MGSLIRNGYGQSPTTLIRTAVRGKIIFQENAAITAGSKVGARIAAVAAARKRLFAVHGLIARRFSEKAKTHGLIIARGR